MKVCSIKVRGFHCDAYGHVNNARYLEFLEEGRWNWLQPALDSGTFKPDELLFVLVNLNISYKKALVSGDLAEISVESIAYRNMSILIQQKIVKGADKALCAQADITFVLLDAVSGKPVPIGEQIQQTFNNIMN